DPLPEKSQITAFVVSADGEPTAECWEITNMVDNQQIQRADGSKATAYALSLARSSELHGVDILKWPSYSPIWPIPDTEVRTEWFDLANHFSMFTVQGGLIKFNANFRLGSNDEDHDEDETHIFSLENGDDWFYFEDNYSGSSLARSANAKPFPFTISTISSTETEVLRLKFNVTPEHKVIHKGACKFTRIRTPAESSSYGARTSRVHSPLAVQ
ncbi:MAG: hypothetical protein Q9164_007842, partial [Protoblastenia rupestris]